MVEGDGGNEDERLGVGDREGVEEGVEEGGGTQDKSVTSPSRALNKASLDCGDRSTGEHVIVQG